MTVARYSRAMSRVGALLVVLAVTWPAPSVAGTSEELETLEREAIKVGEGVEPPTLSRQTPLEDKTPEGTVTVKVLIDATGEVREVVVLESSDRGMDKLAKKAMFARHYFPAKKDGQAVAVWWTTTIRFHTAESQIEKALKCDPATVDTSPAVMPTEDMQLPVIVRRVSPNFTRSMRQRGEGRAVLQCRIDVCGRVDSCTPLESTGPEYTEAAKHAVLQWIYQPAMQNGRPIAVYYTVRVDFRMR